MSIKAKIDELKNSEKEKKEYSKRVQFRITPKLYEELESEYKKLAYSNLSDYLRSILEDRKKSINERELLEYKLFLLGKIGNNINQIAKIMNEDRKKNGEVDYKKTALNFEKMLEQYYKLIKE